MGQNDIAYTEEDIKNILDDLFQHALPDKNRIIELFNWIKDRYI